MVLSYSLRARASSDYCRRHDILKVKCTPDEGGLEEERKVSRCKKSADVRNMVLS